jgi:hypothetical protein
VDVATNVPALKTANFWVETSHSSEKAERFVRLQDDLPHLVPADSFFGLLFKPEDGGDMFLRNPPP